MSKVGMRKGLAAKKMAATDECIQSARVVRRVPGFNLSSSVVHGALCSYAGFNADPMRAVVVRATFAAMALPCCVL
jgi:hypothetical protein